MPWEAARFVVASRATRVSAVVERVRACADAILSVCGIVADGRGLGKAKLRPEQSTEEGRSRGMLASVASSVKA